MKTKWIILTSGEELEGFEIEPCSTLSGFYAIWKDYHTPDWNDPPRYISVDRIAEIIPLTDGDKA